MARIAIQPLSDDFAHRALAGTPHLVQNSREWFDFIAEYSGERDCSIQFCIDGEPVGFLRTLQYRDLVQSLPYPASYAGPIFLPEVGREDQSACMRAAIEHFATTANVLSICRTPIVPSVDAWTEQFEYSAPGRIHVIDLGQELLAGTTSKFRNNLRRNLRKAGDAGVGISASAYAEDLGCWYEIYRKRCRELKAPILPLRYFELMFRHLSPIGGCRLISARTGEKYLGGTVVVNNDYCADYYLSMFDRDCDEMQASTASFCYLLSWARSAGLRYLNLQASPSGQSELAQFKAAWGAQEIPQRYLVTVLNSRDQVLSRSVDQIREEYKFHFYLPFAALTNQGAMAQDREVVHA